MSLITEEDTIDWLRKWHYREQEEKILLHKYQETLIGDIMNLKASIIGGRMDD